MDLELIRIIFFFSILIATAFWELKFKKIPGVLILFGIFTGILLWVLTTGRYGFMTSLIGLVAGWLPFAVVHKMGVLGKGEVRLMAMVGAMGGLHFVILAYIYTAVVGVAMAIGVLIWKRQLLSGLKRSLLLGFRPFLSKKARLSGQAATLTDTEATIPYGIAIIIGSYLAFFMMLLKP